MNQQTWDVGDLVGEKKEKTEEPKEMTIREKVLDEAKKAVCQDRNNQYGEPEHNFEVIAEMWADYLRLCGVDLDYLNQEDVAFMMAQLKLARIITAKDKPTFDSFVDLIGYAACAAECVFGGQDTK